MNVLDSIGHALWMAFVMFWDIFWGLSLGFLFSAIIEELVSKDEMSRLLPDAGPRSILVASGLGAASSSCSYAAVAMARSMVRKGADFTAAMAFQFAATNLVLELGVLLIVLLGWQFGVAEFIGGPIMIVLLVLTFRLTLKPEKKEAAIAQAKLNAQGSMEGHAEMSMVKHEGRWRDRLTSRNGWIAISHGFVMNWAMLWKDILVGVLVARRAGSLGARRCLAIAFLERASVGGLDLGCIFRASHRDCLLYLLRRQYPLCRSSVERRDQFWRRDCLHLRGSHHPPNLEHLSQVLRRPNDRLFADHLLFGHGRIGVTG